MTYTVPSNSLSVGKAQNPHARHELITKPRKECHDLDRKRMAFH